ncbi:MAG: hypothetical protein U1F98_07810 [Verrucomicrobiota bacterium]
MKTLLSTLKLRRIFLAAALLATTVAGERQALAWGRYYGGDYYADRRVAYAGVGVPGCGYAYRGVAVGPNGAVAVRGAGVAPGCGVVGAGYGAYAGYAALPRGYYYSVPSGYSYVFYNGAWCYYVNNVYYRPVYYQGTLVYTVVP